MPSSTTAASKTKGAPAPTATSSILAPSVRTGALAAVATWAIVVLPALIGWIAAPESSLGWFSAVSVGSALWFLGHAQSVAGGPVAVSLTPIVLLLLNVYVSVRFLRRLTSVERVRATPTEWGRLTKRSLVPGFLGGYVAIAALAATLTIGGPVRPGVAGVVGASLVPLAALGVVLVRPDDDQAPDWVRGWFERGPTWLPTAWRVGWRGAGLLLLAGFAVVLARLLLSAGAVVAAQGGYGVNAVAAMVVVLAQLLMLGNAVTWALSFVAGPGFSLAVSATISPAAAHPGLLPLIPMLAALPDEADYPPSMYAVLLLPVVVGVLVGRWVDRELDFFGNWRARVAAVASACALAALAVGCVAALGNGALGSERLSSIGVPTIAFVGALLAEVVAGAALWVGWRLLRERGSDHELNDELTDELTDES